jgi:hypothetical protein
MILYYALGGGLGHITRSLAVLQRMNGKSDGIRLLVSSNLAAVAAPVCSCPIDYVPKEVMSSRPEYYRYLTDYLKARRVATIILDSFPFGIVGEWAGIAPEIPRLLIARSLLWREYSAHIGSADGPWPSKALVIEPLDPLYFSQLKKNADLEFLDAPIVLDTDKLTSPGVKSSLSRSGASSDWVVAHSGPEEERAALLGFAQELMRRQGRSERPAVIFPDQNLYPAEPALRRFANIVTGAGYNMAALALRNRDHCRHYLYPFKRRFDDQHQRAAKLSEGTWLKSRDDGAGIAGEWVKKNAVQPEGH